MERYEYKVVPAPDKGLKAKGVKDPAERFALALETAMNELAADGWEFHRAETLPALERQGLTGSKSTERHVLVFRRMVAHVPAVPRHEAPYAAPVAAASAPVEDAPADLGEAAGTEPAAPDRAPLSADTSIPLFTRKLQEARAARASLRTERRDGPEDDEI